MLPRSSPVSELWGWTRSRWPQCSTSGKALEAHRILLRGEARRFLIIEDMNLDWDLTQLRHVMALPLFLEGLDSAPCTVVGVVE